MVAGRLLNRLRSLELSCYGDYLQLVKTNQLGGEQQHFIDCLTTNETFFFREQAHFEFLRSRVIPERLSDPFRVWSAACSSGEETYSIAMELAQHVKQKQWQLFGSDINSQVLARAAMGHYPMMRHEGIPSEYLKRYCLKGTGSQENTFLIKKELRDQVHFQQINLKVPLPSIGQFDVIFLRNVLIYFSGEVKEEVVKRVIGALKTGGYLFISHTENLHGLDLGMEMIKPSIFIKKR